MATISSLSKEYVLVRVDFTVAGVATDPTGDTVQLAFLASGTDPTNPDWITGSWESDVTVAGHPIRYARALVGPGATALAKGSYVTWVKVGDSPEIPVKQAVLLQVV